MALEGLKNTAMLPIPRKEGEEVDLIAPLRQYIVSSYQQDPSTYDDKLLKIQNLRKEALQAAGDELGAMVLQRYHGQLEYLAMKFRLSDGHIAIPFKWKDAFTGEEGSQTSDTFERASVLFNLGATQATLASEAARMDVNALKAACAYLQAAAGVFTHIKEKCTGMPTSDLSADTMNFLIPLMLGQAQECVIERSVMDKGKASVLAKLCMECSKHYQQANGAVQDNKKKYDSQAPYSVETAVKQHFFKALAYYYRSVQSAEANEFGPRIAYLKEGIKCAKQAKSTLSRSNLQPTSEAVKELQTKLDAVLAEAIKDNDNVYHELVPESVPELQAVSIVKPSPLLTGPDAAELVGPDIFNTLVPMGVTMSVSQYSEEKAKVLRQAKEEFAACNEELQKQLDAMHLPGALRQSQSEGPGLPDKLARRRQNVLDAGGLTAMEDAFKDLATASDKVKGSVETLRAIMEEEQGNESIIKSGDPSYRSNPAMTRLVKETTGCVGAYEQALESNALLTERFERAKSALGALCSNDVESMLPTVSEDVDPAVAKLESLMTKVDQMTSHRAQLEAELRDMIENDDITDKLLHNAVYGDGNADRERQIMDEALRKYQDIQGIIRLNIDAQAPLLRAITEANASFAMARQGGERGEMLRDLESAAETYEYCMDKLNDAQQFWKKMEKMCDDLHLRWADLQGGHPRRTPLSSKPPPPRPASSKPALPPKPGARAFVPDMSYTPPTGGYTPDNSMSAYNPLAPSLDHGLRGGWSPEVPPLGSFSSSSMGSLPPVGGFSDFNPPPPFNPEMGPLPMANAPPMSAEDAAVLTAMGRLPQSRTSLTGSSTLSSAFSTPPVGYGAPFGQPAVSPAGAAAVAPMDRLMQLAQLQPDLFTPEMMTLLVQDPALLQALLAGLPPEATQPPTTAAPPGGQGTSLMAGATPQTTPLPPIGALAANLLMPGPVMLQPGGMPVQPQVQAQPAVSPMGHILMPGPVMLPPAPAPQPVTIPQQAPAQMQQQAPPMQPQQQMGPPQPVHVAQQPVPQQQVFQPMQPAQGPAPMAQQPAQFTPQPQPPMQPQPTYQQPMVATPQPAPTQYQQQQPPLQGPPSVQTLAPAQTQYSAPAAQPGPQQYQAAPTGQPQQQVPQMQHAPAPASPPRPVQSPGTYGAQYQQQQSPSVPAQPQYTAPSQPTQQAPAQMYLQSPMLSQPAPQQYNQQMQQQQPRSQPMPQWSSPQPQPQNYAPPQQLQQPEQPPPTQPTPPQGPPLTCSMPPPNRGMPSQQPGARQAPLPQQVPLQPQPAPQASPSGQQPYQQPQQQPLQPMPAQGYNQPSPFMQPQPQPQPQPTAQGPPAQTWTQSGPSGAPQQQGYPSSPHQPPHQPQQQALQQPPQQTPQQQPQWGQQQTPRPQGLPGPSPAPQQQAPQQWHQQPAAGPQQHQPWASPSQHPPPPQQQQQQQQQWASQSPAPRPQQQDPPQQYGPPPGHGPQSGYHQACPSHMQGPPGQQPGPMPEHVARFENQEQDLMARLERIRMNASLNPHQKDPAQQHAAKPTGPPSRPSASKPGENKPTLVHRPAPAPPQGPTALNPGAPVMLGASSVMYDPVLFQQQQMASSQILHQQIDAQRRLLEQTMNQYRVPGQMPPGPGQQRYQLLQGYPQQSPNQGQQYGSSPRQ